MEQEQKTSLYLVRRAEALLDALRFFAEGTAGAEGRIQFVAQLEFWEWELDNLVYSFTNLAERQRTWSSAERVTARLGQFGLTVPRKLIRRVRWRGRWQVKTLRQRVAPLDLLQQVIDQWNALIDDARTHLEPPDIDRREWSSPARLEQFHKAVPALEELHG